MIGDIINQIIIRPTSNLLFVIYNYVGDFGVAIIIFTILVKFLLWPLVKKQFNQTRLMRKMQPELAEIRKNAKGNKTVEQLQVLELYKKYKFKPFSSFITLIIQLPIFIALYSAITTVAIIPPNSTQSNVDIQAYSFVSDMPRIREIIDEQKATIDNEEHVYGFKPQLFGIIDLNARAISPEITLSSVVVLLFAIVSAFSQFLITKQQNPIKKKKKTFKELMKDAADGKDPEQSDINAVVSGQMTYFMPIMMFMFMINFVGAISFYYFLSNIITLLQQKYLLAKDVRKMDDMTDKTILKELTAVEEGQIIRREKSSKVASAKNKNITRIKASSTKKRRRK